VPLAARWLLCLLKNSVRGIQDRELVVSMINLGIDIADPPGTDH
jgi:hypothetical protein